MQQNQVRPLTPFTEVGIALRPGVIHTGRRPNLSGPPLEHKIPAPWLGGEYLYYNDEPILGGVGHIINCPGEHFHLAGSDDMTDRAIARPQSFWRVVSARTDQGLVWLLNQPSGAFTDPEMTAVATLSNPAGGIQFATTPIIQTYSQSLVSEPALFETTVDSIQVKADGLYQIGFMIGVNTGTSNSRTTARHELLIDGSEVIDANTYHRTRTNNNRGTVSPGPFTFKVGANSVIQLRSRRIAGAGTLITSPFQSFLEVRHAGGI